MNTCGDQLLSYFQVISLDDIPHALSPILHSTTIPHHEPFCKHDACSECLQSVQAQLRRVKTAKQKQRLHTLGTKSTALPLSSASICSALHCCRLTSTLTVEPTTIALHTVYSKRVTVVKKHKCVGNTLLWEAQSSYSIYFCFSYSLSIF